LFTNRRINPPCHPSCLGVDTSTFFLFLSKHGRMMNMRVQPSSLNSDPYDEALLIPIVHATIRKHDKNRSITMKARFQVQP
jgi:hypothetical protein